MLAWYRTLIALRRARPELTDPRLDRVRAEHDDQDRWLVVHRGRLRIAANLGPSPQRLPLGAPATGVLAASSPARHPGRRHRGHAPRHASPSSRSDRGSLCGGIAGRGFTPHA